MKIYIITNEAYPNGMAAASRITCYAKALIMGGIEVEVVNFHRTESPLNLHNTVSEGYNMGIPFRYIGGTTIRKKSILRKVDDYIDMRKTISYLKRNMRAGDAILAYMRQDVFSVDLINFARSNNYPIVRDLCEYPYATTAVNKKTTSKCEKYMRSVFPNFDGAICISEPLFELAKRFAPHAHHIKIPILIDESKCDFTNIAPKNVGVPYIFHSGTLHQQKDGVINVLRAFAEALPSIPVGTKYLFSGKLEKSCDAGLIIEEIKRLKIEKSIEFLGYLSCEDLLQYQKGASLFIVNKEDNIQNKYCFATKIGEYLLSGNPVLTTDYGEQTYYLHNGENAFIVNQGDVQAMSKSIIKIFSNENLGKRIGLQGKLTSLGNFTIVSQSHKLVSYFRKLYDNK